MPTIAELDPVDANPHPEPEEEPPCKEKEEPETEPPTYHISQIVIEFSYFGPTLGPTERKATLYVRGDGLVAFSQYGDVITTPWHGGFHWHGPDGDATLNYEYRGYHPYMSVNLFKHEASGLLFGHDRLGRSISLYERRRMVWDGTSWDNVPFAMSDECT